VRLGFLELPVGTFCDRVVVRDREYVKQAYWFDTEVGADLNVLDSEVPEHLRPALELAKQLMANRDDSTQRGDTATMGNPSGAPLSVPRSSRA
jgi:hypothetical protein